jgi:hypothetical protein
MMALRLTGSARDYIAKDVPRPDTQLYAATVANFRLFFFFSNIIRKEINGVNRIQLWIEGSYFEGNLFLYREWDGMVFALRKIMITISYFFYLLFLSSGSARLQGCRWYLMQLWLYESVAPHGSGIDP